MVHTYTAIENPRSQDREGNSKKVAHFQALLFNMAAQPLGMEEWLPSGQYIESIRLSSAPESLADKLELTI